MITKIRLEIAGSFLFIFIFYDMKENTYISGSIDYQMKYYQMMKEIEELQEKNRKKREAETKDELGPVSELEKYRRGRSKF